MAWPPPPNTTITWYDRNPSVLGAIVLHEDVPIRQLKPWGPYENAQYSTGILGFLYRWVIFWPGFRIQHTSNMTPDVFWATIDGDTNPGAYQGAWSQNVIDAETGEIAYIYMVLRHVVSTGP